MLFYAAGLENQMRMAVLIESAILHENLIVEIG